MQCQWKTGLDLEGETVSENFGKCVVCGSRANVVTGYAFMEDGSELVGVGFCDFHLRGAGLAFANPVFQNRKALELFRERHPQLYIRNVKGKRIVFLEVS